MTSTLQSLTSHPSGNRTSNNIQLSKSQTYPKKDHDDDDVILRWSKLEYERDTKRRALEANFEQRAIARAELLECQRRNDRLLEDKRQLEYELQHLDDQIMSLEDDCHQLALPSTREEEKVVLTQQTNKLPIPMLTLNYQANALKLQSDTQKKQSLKDHLTNVTSNVETQSLLNSESSYNDNQQNKRAKESLQQYPWSGQVLQLMKHTFRIPEFRQHQKEVIDATLNQQDVFCIMRTGGGKSLTYQLPAILEGRSNSRKVTVVVSPLLSLIQDQEEQMNQFCSNSAISFTSASRTSSSKGNAPQQQKQWSRAKNPDGGVCMILVTPERIHKSKVFIHQLQDLNNQGRLGRFVIDEAHCATQWGHDFRPDYAQLGKLKETFPHIPLLALTATASDPVRKDVCQILRLNPKHIFLRSSANRPNLKYSVRCKPDTKDKLIEQMVQYIQQNHPTHAGIVYTFSRKEADEVAKQLKHNKISAAAYHSSISATTKCKIHNSWMRNKIQVVVATIAFGLGINKPDVRFVLHHSISKTLEAYYQESGRAGRDGLPADCVLWYSPRDVPKILAMISGTSAERSSFWPMIRYGQAHGNDAVCRAILMAKLGEPNSSDPSVVHKQNEGITSTCRDVSEHVRTLLKMMQAKSKEKLTLAMIVKEWRTKSPTLSCLRENPPHKDLRVDECERIVVMLLVEEIVHPIVVSNKYSNCVYIVMGENVSRMVSSKSLSVSLHLPIHDASNSSLISKKPRTVSTSNALTMVACSAKPTKKRKYSSESIQTKTSSTTVDLVHSEEEDEKVLDEEDVVSQCESNDETDILWDDESDSEEELEFVG